MRLACRNLRLVRASCLPILILYYSSAPALVPAAHRPLVASTARPAVTPTGSPTSAIQQVGAVATASATSAIQSVAESASAAPPRAQQGALDLNGAPVDFFRAAAGKVAVLVFVRTDCPVSNRYIPQLEQIRTRFADRAAFWFVYPDSAESVAKIRAHDHEFALTTPSLRDPQHALVKLAEVTITPEVAVFDAHRRLIYHGRIDNLYVDLGRKRQAATTHELVDAIQAAATGSPLAVKTAPAVGCYIADIE